MNKPTLWPSSTRLGGRLGSRLGLCAALALAGACENTPGSNGNTDQGSQNGDMGATGPDLFADPDSQIPPVLSADGIEAWIATGKYKAWKCEPSPVMRSSAHGTNRVCSNAFLSGATSAPYPVNSASVKELFNSAGTSLVGYAFSMRLTTGDGGSCRYWYERFNTTVTADGQGVTLCASCHADPDQKPVHDDYVFIIVK